VSYSSKEKYPFRDVAPLVRRVYDAFGPERIIWGGCGSTMEEFEKQSQMLEQMFAFAAEGERARIRGENAMKLFRF
jgi:predicted TIM-barrel fold metal-dependent hydrolase